MNYALFFKNIRFYNELYTVRLGAILRPFWHREGSMAELSRAEPGRAGPGRLPKTNFLSHRRALLI